MNPLRLSERLDRQLRIPGWRQETLAQDRVGVVGDADLLASVFVLGAAALGLNRLIVLAPRLEPRLLEASQHLNPEFSPVFLEGWLTHPAMGRVFEGCRVLVDLSRYGLATKLSLELGRKTGLPVVRAFLAGEEGSLEARVLTCLPGRESLELQALMGPRSFPGAGPEDGALALTAAGLALEAVKNLLMHQAVAPGLVTIPPTPGAVPAVERPLLVIGAGALGNFVGLGLVWSGFRRLVFMDPDRIETTNLNRQVLFYGAVGQAKARTLADRLNRLWGARAEAREEYYRETTDLGPYGAVFDCVDNFETRIALSAACQRQGKLLVSGGAGVEAGQVVVYDPQGGGPTPAELLGLQAIVRARAPEGGVRERSACVYQPDPAVIMTNMVIGGLMVLAGRGALAGEPATARFYDRGRLLE
jgi:molybdopterin/thiamine biosynthesis adenylyltransferase